MIRYDLKKCLVDLDTSCERISYFLHFSDELEKFSFYLFVQRKILAM
jgi:hypothetical protein